MIYFLPLFVMLLWLCGGQISKGFRRFGVPGLTILILTLRHDTKLSKRLKALVYLLLTPILLTGYGIDSKIMKLVEKLLPNSTFKIKDLTTRAIYAIMLSVPLGIYAPLVGQPAWKYALCTLALIGAFLIRADKLFSIGKFDLLVEDLVRSLTLGYSIVWLAS